MSALPPPTPKPCRDCPWLRSSLPGWLGPLKTDEWLEVVHSDAPIACHETIKEANEDGFGSWDHPKIRQCAGSGIFRENVCKSPRNPEVFVAEEPDKDTVFANNQEFRDHHQEANERVRKVKERRANA